MMTKREVVSKVEKHIISGGVVMAHKTKALIYGGRHWVSVGRSGLAVPDPKRRYMVSYTGKHAQANRDTYHSGAYQAAHEFVSFVGKDIMKYDFRR